MAYAIRGKVKGKEGGFFCYVDDQIVGELLFKKRHRYVLIVKSTTVQPNYKGLGLAQMLTDALRNYCINNKLIIRSECSYIDRVVQKDTVLLSMMEEGDSSPELIELLQESSDPSRSAILQRFFKTGSGEYGYGDVFLGVDMPTLRKILKEMMPISLATIKELWQSKYHECRVLGFLALARRMKYAETSSERRHLYELYIQHSDRCNNWDLVDQSAPTIVSAYLLGLAEKERLDLLEALGQQDHLWRQRISIVGTHGLVRLGYHREALHLCQVLMNHKHDLIHKAIGWTLREVGKRCGEELLTEWLDRYATKLPRTALRYALERLSPEQRTHYMYL